MRALPLVLALAVLAPASPAERAGDAGAHAWDDALELARGAYVVKTNTYPAVARSLLGRLTEAYVFFEDRFGPLEGKARRAMRVEVFAGRAEYMESGGGVRGASGHFDAARDACAVVWRRRPDDSWPVAVHEATHHYFRRRFPLVQPPSWYSEGIACWFEGLLDDGAPGHVARLRVRSARQAFAEGKARLDDVLRARARVQNGRLSMDEFRPSRFYGLSWSLCHFLATDDRYRDGFRRFELRLFASRTLPSVREHHGRKLLAEECGDLDALERAWHVHLENLARPEAPASPPVYRWELTAADPYVRWSALRRLQDGDVPGDLARAVRGRLADTDRLVRLEAGRLVAEDGTAAAGPEGVAALLRAVDLGDREVKRLALGALDRPDAGAAVPRLLRETEDREPALRALATIGDRRSFPTLRLGLHDPDVSPAVRARCATALAADPRAVESLRLAAEDANRAVRLAAKTALGRLERRLAEPPPNAPGPDKVRSMLAVLENAASRPRERVLACRMLGLARAREAVPLLRRHCRVDFEDRVRLAAVRALVAITGETRGFRPAQPIREREAVYRRWTDR